MRCMEWKQDVSVSCEMIGWLCYTWAKMINSKCWQNELSAGRVHRIKEGTQTEQVSTSDYNKVGKALSVKVMYIMSTCLLSNSPIQF